MNRAATDFSSSTNQAVSVFLLIVIATPIIVFLGYYSFSAPNTPLIKPDSEGYLQFAAYRTGGYPFFLELLKPIIRDASDYALAQRLLSRPPSLSSPSKSCEVSAVSFLLPSSKSSCWASPQLTRIISK